MRCLAALYRRFAVLAPVRRCWRTVLNDDVPMQPRRRIENFDGQTVHRGHDVTRFIGVARRHVFTGGDQADHMDVWLELAQYFECT